MVIMAHPDDPEFFCGGTVARWARDGCEIVYVVITNGNKGSNDPKMTPERLAAIREEEQREAARRLGVKEVVFLGYNDGELMADLRLRADLVRQIRRYRPDVVICQDPTTYFWPGGGINHPDHRAAGEAAIAAVFPLARDRLNFPEQEREGLRPHKVEELYVSGTTQPDTWIDISETLEDKIQAILAHRSQIKEPEKLAERIREWAAQSDQGRPPFAEGFRKIVLR